MSVWKIMEDAGRIRLLILLHARYFYVFYLLYVLYVCIHLGSNFSLIWCSFDLQIYRIRFGAECVNVLLCKV